MSLGAFGENLAEKFLKDKGYSILKKNYHSRFGEIDIVAKDKDTLVFVEVKTRSSFSFGTPLEAINSQKLRKLIKTSQFFLNQFGYGDVPYRFDAIEVITSNLKNEINHLENITS